MSYKNLLVLTFLVGFITQHQIQALITGENGTSTSNLTNLIGNWYLIASTDSHDSDVCMKNIVTLNSANNITMYLMRNDLNVTERDYNISVNLMRRENSTLAFGKLMKNSKPINQDISTPEMEIFQLCDMSDQKYIILVVKNELARIIANSDELVLLFNRGGEVLDTITEDVEELEMYRDYVKNSNGLRMVNSAHCPRDA